MEAWSPDQYNYLFSQGYRILEGESLNKLASNQIYNIDFISENIVFIPIVFNKHFFLLNCAIQSVFYYYCNKTMLLVHANLERNVWRLILFSNTHCLQTFVEWWSESSDKRKQVKYKGQGGLITDYASSKKFKITCPERI